MKCAIVMRYGVEAEQAGDQPLGDPAKIVADISADRCRLPLRMDGGFLADCG